MSSTGSRAPRSTRTRARKATGGDVAKADGGAAATFGEVAAKSEPHRRSSSYRAETRKAAATAYHADAFVMARMGYVPESEAWSTQLEQVLVVGYVHAPDRTAAVLDALTHAAADEPTDRGGARTPAAPTERWRLGVPVTVEARLLAGALGGAVAGAATCLVLAWVSGESLNAIMLGAFAVLGLLLGSMAGLPSD